LLYFASASINRRLRYSGGQQRVQMFIEPEKAIGF
jgi:hypothetical protein